jgi:hypothetical protein
MADKGLSNNPKVRAKIANKYQSHREYFGAKANQMSETTVKSPYGSRYDTDRYYPKRLNQFNTSYKTGKPQFSNPIPRKNLGEKYDTKLSANKGTAYMKTINQLNNTNRDIAKFGNKDNRLSGAFEKDKIKKGIKTAKTMGNIVKGLRNITVPGIIAKVMEPKKVGDATLKGNQGEYKRVK